MNYRRYLLICFFFVACACNKISTEESELGDSKLLTYQHSDSLDRKTIDYYDRNNFRYMRERWLENGYKRVFYRYYKSGKLQMKYKAINGELDGKFVTYYDNERNTVKKMVNFKKNEEYGKSIEYCNCGKIVNVSEFIDGKKVSDSISNHNE